MDDIALAEQELGEIGAVLPGRACYKSNFSDMAPAPPSLNPTRLTLGQIVWSQAAVAFPGGAALSAQVCGLIRQIDLATFTAKDRL